MMEHKAIIIGGGIAAVLIVGVIVVKKHAAANTQQSNAAPDISSYMTTPGYYNSGNIPASAGYASSSDNTPSDSSNSGSTATGGGFDISSLLGPLIAGTINNNAQQIANNAHTSDSAILSTIAPSNGTATVSHNGAGTSVTVNNGSDNKALVDSLYQNIMGRDADTGGEAYYNNLLANHSLTAAQVADQLKASPEYKKAHPNG